MDEQLNRIEAKVDKIDERLDRVDLTLVGQHISLVDHIRRTELLEQQVEPIKKHVNMVNGALKLIGLIGVVAGIIDVFLRLFHH